MVWLDGVVVPLPSRHACAAPGAGCKAPALEPCTALLIAAMRNHGPELVEFLRPGEHDAILLGSYPPDFVIGEWRIGFSGRTQLPGCSGTSGDHAGRASRAGERASRAGENGKAEAGNGPLTRLSLELPPTGARSFPSPITRSFRAREGRRSSLFRADPRSQFVRRTRPPARSQFVGGTTKAEQRG